jgi:Domain of unknown function (DUF4411)
MYIFDTVSLIHAYWDDFPPKGKGNSFWKWLNSIGMLEGIVIPEKVFEELDKKTDGLSDFLKTLPNIKSVATINCLSSLGKVLKEYGQLSDVDLERLEAKADPYLIAHGLVLKSVVVSSERSEPTRLGINKKIPDICHSLNIDFESYPAFLWRMRKLYPD